LKKGFWTSKNFSLGRFKYSFFLRVPSCFTLTSWLKTGGGFRSLNGLVFYAATKPLGEGSLYAAQIGGVGFHSFPGGGAASCGTAILNGLVFYAAME
jgi:hypothetical protein